MVATLLSLFSKGKELGSQLKNLGLCRREIGDYIMLPQQVK